MRQGWMGVNQGPDMRNRQFTISDLLMLVMSICIWLTVTVQLGSLSILFWSLAVAMVAVLRPAHQKRATPNSVTDVLSTAVQWSVVWGIAGVVVSIRWPTSQSWEAISWVLVGQITGFYLGLLWIMVIFLARYVERVTAPERRTRALG